MGGHLPRGMHRALRHVAVAALRPPLGGSGIGCRCGRLRAYSAASTLVDRYGRQTHEPRGPLQQ
eukprot:2157846-Heterocapsa_arctica.AAC.1